MRPTAHCTAPGKGRKRTVYRAMMPVAVDRRSAQCYIAMAAQGMTLGIFSPLEAKAFLYAGQLALAAHGDRS
jgi:hypothetical protein